METNNTKPKSAKIAFLVIILIIVALFLSFSGTNEKVAEVDNNSITKKAFEKRLEDTFNVLKKISNETELTEEQKKIVADDVLNQMIREALIAKYATENGISITKEELEEERQKTVALSGGEEAFKAQIGQFFPDEKTFLTDLERNMLFRRSAEKFLGPEALMVTEKETKDAYDLLVSESKRLNIEQPIPSYEESKGFFAEQIKNQKITSLSEDFIAKLKEQAEINIFI